MGMNEGWDDDDDDDFEDEDVEIMLIEDVDLFLVSLRGAVSLTIAKDAVDEGSLEKYLPIMQMKAILDEYVDGTDEETGLPFMLADAYPILVEDVSSAFLGVCLSKLAAADLIESAWDDERGEQIFWTKPKKKGATDD